MKTDCWNEPPLAAGDANQGGASPEPETTDAPRFTLTRAGEYAKVAECRDFVEGMLCDGTLARIYGPPASAKSFLALELARCVATGEPFGGRAVEAGAVCYLALEGQAGLANRLAAMQKTGRSLGDDFFICPDEFSALLESDVNELAAAINSAGSFRLIVVDTQARTIEGGDENSSADIGQLTKSMGSLIRLTKAAVLLLHHPGKDTSRGGRGHSSVLGAVDSEFEISVVDKDGEKSRVVSTKKQKDLPMGEDFAFRLESIHLGTDRRGKPITSCVVQWSDAPEAPRKGRPRVITPADVLAELEAGAMAQTALIDKLVEKLCCGKSTVKDAIAEAKQKGVVGKNEINPATNQNCLFLYHPKNL
jgi:hypothetical protein